MASADKSLESRVTTVFVPDSYRFGDIVDEDFAVSDFAGSGGRRQGANHLLGARVGRNDFEFHFGQEVNAVLLSAIDLFMAFLAAVAAYFAYGHAIDADVLERFLDVVKLEGLNDCLDFLHGTALVRTSEDPVRMPTIVS